MPEPCDICGCPAVVDVVVDPTQEVQWRTWLCGPHAQTVMTWLAFLGVDYAFDDQARFR